MMLRTTWAAALALAAVTLPSHAETLNYSGTLIGDFVHGGALFDGKPLGPATAFSISAEFDLGQPIAALPIGTATPTPLPTGFAAYATGTVTFNIAGLGSFNVLPGSYAVTLQDPRGPGLFANFAGDYAVGLAELAYPGPGAFLAGFSGATPGFMSSAPMATTFTGDQGAIAEMYVRFTSGDELDFYMPAPVAGGATAALVPEPATAWMAALGLGGLWLRSRAGRRRLPSAARPCAHA